MLSCMASAVLGKTSVMHVLTQAARDARYLVVYVSCGADSNFDEVFRTIAAHIPMLFHSAVGPTSPDVEKGKTLADILPKSTISPRIASDILAKIVGTRVVVVLDEFDRSSSEEFRQNVAELIKNLSDRLVRVQLVIAGVAGNLTELLEHIPSIQRNIFALQVPWMPPAEIRQLVRNGGELCGLNFDEEAEDAVVSAAHGSPYLATLLGHHAALGALDDQRVRVGRGDVLSAIGAAILEFQGRMSGRARVQLKKYSGSQWTPYMGIVAGVSLLSNGAFRKEDLWASTVNAENARRCEEAVSELMQCRSADRNPAGGRPSLSLRGRRHCRLSLAYVGGSQIARCGIAAGGRSQLPLHAAGSTELGVAVRRSLLRLGDIFLDESRRAWPGRVRNSPVRSPGRRQPPSSRSSCIGHPNFRASRRLRGHRTDRAPGPNPARDSGIICFSKGQAASN